MGEEKCNLGDFECGMVVVTDGLLYVFQKLLICWDFPTQPAFGFNREWCEKEKMSREEEGQRSEENGQVASR